MLKSGINLKNSSSIGLNEDIFFDLGFGWGIVLSPGGKMNSYRVLTALLVFGIAITGCQPLSGHTDTTSAAVPGVTVCASGCDYQRIQEAIDAETTPVGSVIRVIDPVHTEAGIMVNKDVTLLGMGANNTIIQAHADPGEGTDRVFMIPSGANAEFKGITIRHGNPKTKPLTGGGILNLGSLTLEDVIVTENYGSAGGGIYNEGTLTLKDSTITNNGSVGGGDRFLECETGGGIKILTGTVTLINSTISENRSKSKGGGVHVACQGTLILQNSIVSGNYSNESGGGIYLNGVGEFTDSTISGNSAYNVGGVAIHGSGEHGVIVGQLTLTNTKIIDNIARLEGYGIPDCDMNEHGTLILNGSNRIGDGSGTCAAGLPGVSQVKTGGLAYYLAMIVFNLGGLFFFIYGLIGLIRGKLSFTKQHGFAGKPAKWVGIGLMILGFALPVIWLTLIY